MLTSNFLPSSDEHRVKYEKETQSLNESWKKDILWMTNFSVYSDVLTPFWAGWNSKISPSNNYVQKVQYLPQINQSPTSLSVVAETMKRSLEVAKEAGRTSIAVTYDLAIAKLAMKIQFEERPFYDSLFIALGPFHIEMAFFSAIGKLVEESGGPHILNECDILAKGSIRSFNKGKNYKRCKRMHEILPLALQVLHFQSFLDSKEK